jgi:hypothetical protein
MIDEQLAAAALRRDAALVEGATFVSVDAQPAGMIQSINADADIVVVEREAGLVSLKREHFAVDANGALMALFTLAQIDSATVAN